jgi:bacterioferritin-associated ferredoxin
VSGLYAFAFSFHLIGFASICGGCRARWPKAVAQDEFDRHEIPTPGALDKMPCDLGNILDREGVHESCPQCRTLAAKWIASAVFVAGGELSPLASTATAVG